MYNFASRKQQLKIKYIYHYILAHQISSDKNTRFIWNIYNLFDKWICCLFCFIFPWLLWVVRTFFFTFDIILFRNHKRIRTGGILKVWSPIIYAVLIPPSNILTTGCPSYSCMPQNAGTSYFLRHLWHLWIGLTSGRSFLYTELNSFFLFFFF